MPYYKIPNDPNPHWLDYEDYEQHLPTGYTQITDAEAQVMRDTQQSIVESTMTYAEKRAAEYPSITDQLDLIYHGGIEAWKEVIDTIKTKYPKG